MYQNLHMWYDQAGSVVWRQYWFSDIVHQRKHLLLFPIAFHNLHLLISLEVHVWFWWGFQQNEAYVMLFKIMKKGKIECHRLKTDFAWSYHICLKKNCAMRLWIRTSTFFLSLHWHGPLYNFMQKISFKDCVDQYSFVHTPLLNLIFSRWLPMLAEWWK